MKMFKFSREDFKCGSCNWRVSNLYVLADTLEEAERLLKEGLAGLCGDCMCELLVDERYTVKAPSTSS